MSERFEAQESFQVPLLDLKIERVKTMNTGDLSKLRMTTTDLL